MMIFNLPEPGEMFDIQPDHDELNALLVHAGKLNTIKYARCCLGVNKREPDPDFQAEYEFCYNAIVTVFG